MGLSFGDWWNGDPLHWLKSVWNQWSSPWWRRHTSQDWSSRWRHHTGTLSSSLVLCEGNLPVTGDFPSQRSSNAEPWCFLCCWAKEAANLIIELPMIWDVITHMWRHWHVFENPPAWWICRSNTIPDTCRNNKVIITSKRRRDVVLT